MLRHGSSSGSGRRRTTTTITTHIPPPPEEDHGRSGYIAALAIGLAASTACFGVAIPFALRPDGDQILLYPLVGLSTVWTEVIAFVINTILTQCFEGLAFIHSLSLRWALVTEERLRWNTNLRLFTSSRSRPWGPNGRAANVLSALCMVVGYTTTSQLFVGGANWDLYSPEEFMSSIVGEQNEDTKTPEEPQYLNCLALIVLGAVILLQTGLAVWCLLSDSASIKYWTSNALNTTLVALQRGEARHRDGRFMMSVATVSSGNDGGDSKHEAVAIPHEVINDTISPTHPSRTQPSMSKSRPATRWIVHLLWFLFVLATVWFLIIVFVTRQLAFSSRQPWDFALSWSGGYWNKVQFDIDTGYMKGPLNEPTPALSMTSQVALGLLFVMAIQGLQTLGIHAAELVVITARDEDTWRRLARLDKSHTRNVIKPNPFVSALSSWKNVLLIIFKSLLHWLLGQTVIAGFVYCSTACDAVMTRRWRVYSFEMLYGRVFVYTCCAGLLAAFVSFLAFKKPRGAQPATWGHIQTIADLVDDWDTDEKGRFWWGDKGEVFTEVGGSGVRHAGLSCRREELQDVRMDALYA
ncbi:hypothetical protein B0H66DRAFT_560079 [Apodospora peruviana]|uniref:Uncharacterized protein n=1 Tax=Apodospora peruviana TaxID=516989 RepID=A0AAE0M246_9PEZI|nr:hypothetical protein B0H66DRAFT_560079 [Apodospora peruviana]